MKRRDFVVALGGAAAWPLAARAQQSVRRIGILMNLAADDPEGQARVAAFLQGLQEVGWVVGRNARIDIRWGIGDAERARKNVPESLALVPDVIFRGSDDADEQHAADGEQYGRASKRFGELPTEPDHPTLRCLAHGAARSRRVQALLGHAFGKAEDTCRGYRPLSDAQETSRGSPRYRCF
jgi:hypothetical protein